MRPLKDNSNAVDLNNIKVGLNDSQDHTSIDHLSKLEDEIFRNLKVEDAYGEHVKKSDLDHQFDKPKKEKLSGKEKLKYYWDFY